MGKKSMKTKNLLIKITALSAAVYGLVAICMGFVESVKYEGSLLSFTVTGFQAALGYSETSGIVGVSVTTQYLAFSIMNLLPYIFALCGVVFAVISLLNKNATLGMLLCVVLFVLAAVFFFLEPSNVVLAEDSLLTKENFKLATGGIIAGVFSVLSAVTMAGRLILVRL